MTKADSRRVGPGRRARQRSSPLGAPPPKAPSGLVDRIVLELGRAIVSGRYPPGRTLPTEAEISQLLRAGRNAVREAVKMLVSKGFVRTERRAGMMVEPKAKWNLLDPQVLSWSLGDPTIRQHLLRDLTEMRFVIEPALAALAADKASTTQVLRLFEAYEHMQLCAHDRVRAIEADILFHERLAEAANNQLMSSISRVFAMLLRANFEITIQADQGRSFIRNLEDHRTIADAIHRRDAQGASEAMRKLLELNRSDLSQMMESPRT
jgi:DNA-binding FadR family transcriptional regulator